MESRRVSGSDNIGNDLTTNQVVSQPSNAVVDTPIKDKTTEEEIPVSSMPEGGQCSDGSAAALTPPTQAVESPVGGPTSAATSHRIPSHVFAPTSATSPAEWSVASNESLFSICLGNTSFSDRLSWVSKSGELGYTIDSTMISGPFVDVPICNHEAPTMKLTESSKKTGNLNDVDEFGTVTEAAAETMAEVMREKESQHKNNVAEESPHSHSMSQHSDASGKSFAFPILTGDADKNDTQRSIKNNKQPSRRLYTPKTTPKTPPETPKPPRHPETPKSQTPKATQNGGPRRWFFCFSCFPSCS